MTFCPCRALLAEPVAGHGLKGQGGFLLFNGGLNLHPLLFRTWVNTSGKLCLGFLTAFAGILEGHGRVGAKAQRLALALKAVVHAPEHSPGRREKQVQPAAVRMFGLIPCLEFSQINIR